MSAEFVESSIINNTRSRNIRRVFYFVIKRSFDITFSLIGLIIFFPFLILVSLLIKIDSKGPIFYKQRRIGKEFKCFKIFKFRTMTFNADKKGAQITYSYDERITRIGKFLRRLKIDEVPQLINVFFGNMTFVGPRPEVPKYVNLTPEFKKILSISPGITDYASIKYFNEEEVLSKAKKEGKDIAKYYKDIIQPDKINLNLKYIREMSIATDIILVIRTLFLFRIINIITFRKLINRKKN